jgi:hypothetical protein
MPFVISAPFAQGAYDKLLSTCGGSPLRVFVAIGDELTKRVFAQQDVIPPSDAYVSSLWEALWSTIATEGLPRPLEINEIGEPRVLEDAYLFNLAESTLSRLPRHRAEDLLRTLCVQVLTALLSPEFKACRQSYQLTDASGTCLRQSAEHCRDRISGTHCEDCPFFVALSQDQHRKLLARAFSPQTQADWLSRPGLFLPEDFRSLRIFWHLHIRQPRA